MASISRQFKAMVRSKHFSWVPCHMLICFPLSGLIVSTPTGSTAYAVAAGASMIHPSVPAIMVTPICPHSLSFRPIVVPAGVELKISISPDSRNTSWVSFDGRNRQELLHGDRLVQASSNLILVLTFSSFLAFELQHQFIRCQAFAPKIRFQIGSIRSPSVCTGTFGSVKSV